MYYFVTQSLTPPPIAVTSFMNDPLINSKFSRLELLDGILQMLREVNLFEPALVIVVEVQCLVNDPELLQESGHLDLEENFSGKNKPRAILF